MKKLLFAGIAIALSHFVLAAPAQAATITVTHAQGGTELPENPRKVLVFDLASLDTLDALGVEVGGVPSGNLPAYLSKYASDDIAKVGSLFEPDFEAVNAAEPDLIIVGGRSSPKYAELSRLAPTIDMTLDQSDYLGSMKKNVETLARIFGKEEEAAKRLAALDEAVAGLRKSGGEAGSVLVILTTGGRMSAHGPGSRFGVVYADFGLKPAAEGLDTGNHGQAISNEFILETNPDWLFVVDRDAAIGREGQAARQLLDNELVAQTTAWKNDQVVYLDPASWYLVGGGLTAIGNSVKQISDAFARN
ncbi:siderophore ABC transporter substrate-binding protein [Aquamicrobium sp. LC103]|uniref:siderophore ABC transporter substrate-binding protein n=1 Tax=Aquamicrobium sp. LC103 TaxID=1120658 RepID=UPI00063ECB8E|nr:siderophore ABC transporter substrate-binding protein [Aquamicrobium sp. LC103]TKT69699.1 siderophore ABC transporter substrate-binding protein [Aquamicrobium sp. LC103]